MKAINKFIGKHMMTLALVIGLVVLCGVMALYNASGAKQDVITSARLAVEAQGYTNVQYVDVDLFSCGDSHAGYIFNADNASGGRVRLVACSPDGDAGANWRGNWFIVTKGK